MDFNKKGNREFFNNKLLFKTLGIAFLIIIFSLIFADFKIYQKKQELTSQIDAYQKQIEDIKAFFNLPPLKANLVFIF